MADNLARAQLARAAQRLSRQAGACLPPLIFLTDDERVRDPLGAVRCLPRGSLVILRSRDPAKRRALAHALSRITGANGLRWVVADDATLASDAGAHGVHFPEQAMVHAARWRARRPRWLITCAAHSLRTCLRAASFGVDAVLLAPVFPTASHPDRRCLGNLRARAIANAAGVPVYALGGINAETATGLAGSGFAGLAAVGGLSADREALATGRCATAVRTV